MSPRSQGLSGYIVIHHEAIQSRIVLFTSRERYVDIFVVHVYLYL